VNDAVGGATTGTLYLTQTAIGGNGGSAGGAGGSASSTLIATNPYGSSNYNLSTYAMGGNGGLNSFQSPGGAATAITTATKACLQTGFPNR